MRKVTLYILSSLLFTVFLMTFPLAKANAQSQTFLKCNGKNHGTVWASFGRLMKADEDFVRLFPAEIVVFSKETSSRILFDSWRQAIDETQVIYGERKFAFSFKEKRPSGVVTHRITVLTFYKESPYSYQGNWRVSAEGKEDSMDMALCTIM